MCIVTIKSSISDVDWSRDHCTYVTISHGWVLNISPVTSNFRNVAMFVVAVFHIRKCSRIIKFRTADILLYQRWLHHFRTLNARSAVSLQPQAPALSTFSQYKKCVVFPGTTDRTKNTRRINHGKQFHSRWFICEGLDQHHTAAQLT